MCRDTGWVGYLHWLVLGRWLTRARLQPPVGYGCIGHKRVLLTNAGQGALGAASGWSLRAARGGWAADRNALYIYML